MMVLCHATQYFLVSRQPCKRLLSYHEVTSLDQFCCLLRIIVRLALWVLMIFYMEVVNNLIVYVYVTCQI